MGVLCLESARESLPGKEEPPPGFDEPPTGWSGLCGLAGSGCGAAAGSRLIGSTRTTRSVLGFGKASVLGIKLQRADARRIEWAGIYILRRTYSVDSLGFGNERESCEVKDLEKGDAAW